MRETFAEKVKSMVGIIQQNLQNHGGNIELVGSHSWIQVFFHELAHAAHHRVEDDLKGGQVPSQEIIAEQDHNAKSTDLWDGCEKIYSNVRFRAKTRHYFLLILVKIACVVSFWWQEIGENEIFHRSYMVEHYDTPQSKKKGASQAKGNNVP